MLRHICNSHPRTEIQFWRNFDTDDLDPTKPLKGYEVGRVSVKPSGAPRPNTPEGYCELLAAIVSDVK